jgi:hypothetical protein
VATYPELLALAQNDDLRQRTRVAAVVAADVIRLEGSGVTNHTLRLAWAKRALEDPVAQGERLLWAVLAQNRALTAAQIVSATDSGLQTAVNAAVDLLAQ